MANLITAENITFVIGIGGVIFTVYNYFRNPQINSDKEDALMSQQMDFVNRANEQRFVEMGSRITDAMALAQNHIHTVDTKVDQMGVVLVQMGKEIVKLSTIIDERIPAKK